MAPVTRRRSKMLDDATGEGAGEGAGEGTGIEGTSLTPSKSTPTRRKSLAKRTPKGADKGAAVVEEDGVDVAASELQRVRIETDLLSTKSKRPRSNSVPDSQASSERNHNQDSDEKEEDDDDEADTTLPEPQSASRQLEEEATRHLASQSSGSSLLSGTGGDQKKSDNRKHVVFGDDDDVDQYVAAATAKTAASADRDREDNEDDDDDDDDEAPEAVSTKVAAKETLESAKAIADVAEKHAASLKRKRQERDELYKQQAEKRKRVLAPDADPARPSEAAVEVEPETAGKGRRRADKQKLPNVLPAEYLTDSSSESEDETALRRMTKKSEKPRKINFEDAARSLDKGQRAPRDQVVGSTVYRVVADRADRNLAPKMHKDTRNMREALLKRTRAAVTPNKRKGFFVRK